MGYWFRKFRIVRLIFRIHARFLNFQRFLDGCLITNSCVCQSLCDLPVIEPVGYVYVGPIRLVSVLVLWTGRTFEAFFDDVTNLVGSVERVSFPTGLVAVLKFL